MCKPTVVIQQGDTFLLYDIGTAKPDMEERGGIAHYMIDEVYPNEEFSVAVFQRRAKEYILDIHARGKIPILAGGTGFYINAILFDNHFTTTHRDDNYRCALYDLAKEKGNEYLHNMLREVDEEAYRNIHANNVKRVIRALEYYSETGEKISCHNALEKSREPIYNTAFFILNMDRELLYDRINRRVDLMLEKGLVEEVKNLLDMGYDEELVSMQGLGYKEIAAYLKGRASLQEATGTLKQSTRHFAKRQLTWFSHKSEGCWLDSALLQKNELTDKMLTYMEVFHYGQQ